MEMEEIKKNISLLNRNKPSITHLIYANGLILFIKANKTNANATKEIFKCCISMQVYR